MASGQRGANQGFSVFWGWIRLHLKLHPEATEEKYSDLVRASTVSHSQTLPPGACPADTVPGFTEFRTGIATRQNRRPLSIPGIQSGLMQPDRGAQVPVLKLCNCEKLSQVFSMSKFLPLARTVGLSLCLQRVQKKAELCRQVAELFPRTRMANRTEH
ncbi:hypothetical protein BJ508DRAFT_301454 [Ascobolus immersus RN42]|uniref:Uncharacterized protein n=1 Tax=Ascobolus immersus RN42 TaxID=1160509 RepID=A0A3N4J0D3_ASCIM|nr:hypothetical protein BJ508DRAFT_301454 [Ascobolus immersus RN42]